MLNTKGVKDYMRCQKEECNVGISARGSCRLSDDTELGAYKRLLSRSLKRITESEALVEEQSAIINKQACIIEQQAATINKLSITE